MSADAIVLHGHAYQPPRANPRTGRVPIEPTAAPFPNWNARITAECYRPNAFARILDNHGRIVRIVNNFERMSFDLGPTLARWLEVEAPDVHERIVAGDRVGRTGIAHPYHHAILPLAPIEDARTEIMWGIADFERRFGRSPAGIWFAETAIDESTLALLPPLGIEFTVVAPHQATPAVPAGRVGRWTGPTGAVDLVAYDGFVSHDLAFGNVLADTSAMVQRMAAAAPAGGLVVAATDAETFGHHHRFTERGVAHALFEVAEQHGLRSGGLQALLPGVQRATVTSVPPSAWSCAHGVRRWSDDCGCATDGDEGWSQRWRGPLRRALVVLRDHAVAVFRRRGATIFHEPMAARDDFGIVLADESRWEEFAARHLRAGADPVLARLLLDSQEAMLASFTSCAWFFADLARREVVIVLQEAQRSAELLASIGEPAPTDDVLAILATAISNRPDVPTGIEVWACAAAGDGVLPHERAQVAVEPIAISSLAPVFDDLVRQAVAGDPMAARQASELLHLSRQSDAVLPLDRAQEAIWERLVAGTVPEFLAALAGQLGFAGY